MNGTDVELIEMCLGGNDEAFSEIITRYKKLVFNVIYNLSVNKSDVSDISQEVFLKVYRSLKSYNPQYKFATWLIKITTNVSIDWLRQKKNNHLSVDDITETSDDESNPEDQFIDKEELKQLRKAISELPEMYRVPVVLFHQQHMSYREIEKVINEPQTIVKNRLYRGRHMLKEKLQSYKEEVQAI